MNKIDINRKEMPFENLLNGGGPSIRFLGVQTFCVQKEHKNVLDV